MTVKEYLLQYQKAYKDAQSIELKITQLRLKYALPSAISYSDMPKAHNSNHDLSEYAAKLDGLEQSLINQYGKCMEIERGIINRINRLQNADEKKVLLLRYTTLTNTGKLMYWDDIAAEMGFARQHVDRIHGRALIHFKDVLECYI